MKKFFSLSVSLALIFSVYVYSILPKYKSYDEWHLEAFSQMNDDNNLMAEYCFKKAIDTEPENVDGYAALSYFYSVTDNYKKQKNVTENMDYSFLSTYNIIRSKYTRISVVEADYLINQNNNDFLYYNSDNILIYRDQLFDNDDYKRSAYYYKDGRIDKEVYEKREKGNTIQNITCQYLYDENGLLEEKIDDRMGSIKYEYNDKGDTVSISYDTMTDSKYQKTPYKEFYENGILVKTLSSKGNNTFDTETFYNSKGHIIKTNSLAADGSITKYYIYSCSEENDVVTNEIRCYYPDGVLDYCERKITDNSDTKTIIDKYNIVGEVIKTTTVQNGKETITRPFDKLNNPRKLTDTEIEHINTEHHVLISILNDVFDSPEEMDRDYIVSVASRSDTITDKDKKTLQQLRDEGVQLDYDALEIELAHYIVYDVVKNTDVKELLSNYVNINEEFFKNEINYPYSAVNDSFYIYRKGNSRVYQWTGASTRNILAGEMDDKYVKLYSDYRTMIFEKRGENYYIIAVLEQDNRDMLNIPQTAPQTTPSPSTKYEEVRKTEVLPQDKSKGQAYNTAIKEYNKFLNTESVYGELPGYRGVELYDLTKDGIPELILPYDFGHMSVYSWMGGKLTALDVPSAGGGDGGKSILKNGIIQGTMHKIDYKDYEFYTYNKDGSANKVSFGIYRDYENQCVKCKINGQWVSREEYNKFIQPYRTIYNDYADIPNYPLYESRPIE